MNPSDIPGAIAAARSIVTDLGLTVDEAILVHVSNRLAVHFTPCDVLARVAPAEAQAGAAFELAVATQLVEVGAPIAEPDPRVEPRTYRRDGEVVTLWTYYEQAIAPAVSAADYASALKRLHAGLRRVEFAVPHLSDRVSQAVQLVGRRGRKQALADTDLEVLRNTFRDLSGVIGGSPAREQLLHGEPHTANIRITERGLLFIDLETCCRGPVEFDLAHLPAAVAQDYSGVDQELLDQCRALVLAVAAAWRCDPADRLPNGQHFARELVNALREGPPMPALDVVGRRVIES
jgi:Ser/Thr protein kinase RdoA (MazF antagonist)